MQFYFILYENWGKAFVDSHIRRDTVYSIGIPNEKSGELYHNKIQSDCSPYLMLVHKVCYLLYSCSQNDHPKSFWDSCILSYTSLDSKPSESDIEVMYRICLVSSEFFNYGKNKTT